MRTVSAACLCLLTTACITTSVQRLDQAARPTRSADSVAVLVEAPLEPYTVIALIESRGESVFDSYADLRADMVARAGELGGDAVILGAESTDTKFIFTGLAMIKSDRKRLSGEVIVFGGGGDGG